MRGGEIGSRGQIDLAPLDLPAELLAAQEPTWSGDVAASLADDVERVLAPLKIVDLVLPTT